MLTFSQALPESLVFNGNRVGVDKGARKQSLAERRDEVNGDAAGAGALPPNGHLA